MEGTMAGGLPCHHSQLQVDNHQEWKFGPGVANQDARRGQATTGAGAAGAPTRLGYQQWCVGCKWAGNLWSGHYELLAA
jgi:hypothetical protein